MSPALALFIEVALGVARSARGRTLQTGGREVLTEMLRPEPGLEVVSPRGDLHTGIVVVVDNAAVVALTARHGPPPRAVSRSAAMPPSWPEQDDLPFS